MTQTKWPPTNPERFSYAADWTVAQFREPAQKIADRIEALMQGPKAP